VYRNPKDKDKLYDFFIKLGADPTGVMEKNAQRRLDDELFETLKDSSCDKKKIEELLQRGANIKAHNILDIVIKRFPNVDYDDNEYQNSDSLNVNISELFDYLQYLLDLGADVNIKKYGVNEILNNLSRDNRADKIKIIEFLLKAGADPNGIIDNFLQETIIDKIYHDIRYQYYSEHNYKIVALHYEVIDLLFRYGGNENEEYQDTDEVYSYLYIKTKSKTGLVTNEGNIEPEKIPNISDELVKEFKEWLAREPYQIENVSKESVEEYNAEGLEIAKKFVELVGNEIKVSIYLLDWETDRLKWVDLYEKEEKEEKLSEADLFIQKEREKIAKEHLPKR
jgi:hypothetical protein